MRAEMTVSKNTVIQADMRFSKLLRIEGSVEGKIVAPADVRTCIDYKSFTLSFGERQICYSVKAEVLLEIYLA